MGHSHSDSTGQTAGCGSRDETPSRCGSPTPNTSTASRGATVDRSVVLTGGWQTSRETAYVQATRARNGTDWYVARDQLGIDGQDPDRIERLAQQMSNSRLHSTLCRLRATRHRLAART
jgi:hypothetical protein